MPILPGIVKALFDFESNPIRFERVCSDLFSESEGAVFVATSLNWDLARDARRISIGGKELHGVLCATLSTNLDEKIEADILRLADTTQTKAIVYCTSRPLTENACDKIEASIRALCPGVESVRVLGQFQLIDLGMRFEEILSHVKTPKFRTLFPAVVRIVL